MSLTGNFIDADEALRVGLVNRVVPHDALLPTALQLAADIVTADQAASRVVLAEYEGYVGGGPEAMQEERRVAEEFLGPGIDLVLIEQRRIALMDRARQRPEGQAPSSNG
jgi:enoyl-CoA hydratase